MSQSPLEQIFAADRAMRAAEDRLMRKPESQLAKILSAAVDEAVALDDDDEAMMRLERLADLCAQVPGPAMADALIRILDHDEPAVRVAAGEAILDVAYDYYAEVARAAERALDRGSQVRALAELPFVFVEVGEPSAEKLLARFLASEHASVVAAAIEASTLLLEPGVIEHLAPLTEDARVVTLDDAPVHAELEPTTEATIGELAEEAIAILQQAAEVDGREEE